MRKANVGQKIKARDDKETGRYSQRERTQAVFFSPSKQTQKKEDAANQELVETVRAIYQPLPLPLVAVACFTT